MLAIHLTILFVLHMLRNKTAVVLKVACLTGGETLKTRLAYSVAVMILA